MPMSDDPSRNPDDKSDQNAKPDPNLTKRQTTDQRVSEIINLMTSGMWVPGKCHRELGAKWGITPATVSRLASQASRFIVMMSQGQDKEELQGMMLAGIAGIRAQALSHSRPDFRTALSAYELAAKIQGLIINKHEAKVQEVDSLDDLPPDELASKLEAEAAALRKAGKGKVKK